MIVFRNIPPGSVKVAIVLPTVRHALAACLSMSAASCIAWETLGVRAFAEHDNMIATIK